MSLSAHDPDRTSNVKATKRLKNIVAATEAKPIGSASATLQWHAEISVGSPDHQLFGLRASNTFSPTCFPTISPTALDQRKCTPA